MQGTHASPFQAVLRWWQSDTRRTAPGWALLGLACLFLLGCAQPGTTQQTTANFPSPTSTLTSPSPTPTLPVPSPTPTITLTQQYDFTAQDSGKTVTYGITTRFEIFLNQQQYPKQNIKVSCAPDGAIGSDTNLPYAEPPLYVVRYEGTQPGPCTIKNGAFILNIKIIGT